jgi:hypothetical protein
METENRLMEGAADAPLLPCVTNNMRVRIRRFERFEGFRFGFLIKWASLLANEEPNFVKSTHEASSHARPASAQSPRR